ncbi:expressed unknown protein [Seminavis robusta]|uniref:Glycosyltransferase 61 catalytic domain-containing protein n=1 Tax=Seminavis robusta TaxID=568900 RepID=A0A9N8HLV4_9STRA|nr:expressed unknown protein [Seminavis robusta]|eukprot:Sro845_g209970.1 n/a (462) ;mRNA; f:9389-10774
MFLYQLRDANGTKQSDGIFNSSSLNEKGAIDQDKKGSLTKNVDLKTEEADITKQAGRGITGPDKKDTIYQHALGLVIEERKEEADRAISTTFFNGLLQEGLYPRVYPLQDMFLGPATPHVANRTNHELVFKAEALNQTQAVCLWFNTSRQGHFPHLMQELLRCFSWWQANQHQQPVFVRNAVKGKRPVGYGDDFLYVLKKAFGVQVVDLLDDLPTKQDTRYVYTSVNEYPQPPHLSQLPWFQMHNLQDATLLRKETLNLMRKENRVLEGNQLGGCPGDGSPSSKKQPIIAFLNRNGPRHVDNLGEILESLKKTKVLGHPLGLMNIHYFSSFDKLTFWEQVDVMSKVDIIVGPHGAQHTSVAFLPACGGLLELFPMGYHYPKYFGTLARTTGHYHFHLYTGGTNIDAELNQHMMTLEGRKTARESHLAPKAGQVLKGVHQLTERWQTCCERRLKGETVEALF